MNVIFNGVISDASVLLKEIKVTSWVWFINRYEKRKEKKKPVIKALKSMKILAREKEFKEPIDTPFCITVTFNMEKLKIYCHT
jgi:hypothetical protein